MARTPLSEYRAKRDFARTPEPSGAKTGSGRKKTGLRYVIQKHDARQLHFDFRLEHDGVLKSWAVTRGPSLDPREKRLAVRVEDHPLDYGDFEGTIPKGQYGGGTVMLWDEGTWEPETDPDEGLSEGKLAFRLNGKRLSGGWALVRMRADRGRRATRENWLLIKERDAEAKAEKKPVIERLTASVRTGRTMDEIAGGDVEWTTSGAKKRKRQAQAASVAVPVKRSRKTAKAAKLPDFVPPQLATLVSDVPTGEGWLHEIKFDGYRAVTAVAGGKAVIYTRNGLDWTDKFPAIAGAFAALPCKSALLDGEIAVADRAGHTSFGALQAVIGSGAKGAGYYLFDLLEIDGEDLRSKPLIERKEKLKHLLDRLPSETPLTYSDHVLGQGKEVFRRACDLGLEGVIAKRADAPYRSGRMRSWLKIKCGMSQEFVILGWRPSTVKGRPFSSILIGATVGGRLSYRGRVGSGFGEAQLARLWPELKARAVKKSPVDDVPAEIRRDASYVRPELVAEIAFRGWTTDGLVRQGSFKGLRSDKDPTEVVVEIPEA